MTVLNPCRWKSLDRVYHKKTIKMASNHIVGKSVLDAGCGYGYMSEYVGDRKYVGWDSNPEKIELAKNQYSKHKFYVRDFLVPSLETFDTVLLIDIFEHYKNSIFLLSCIKKLAKKRIILTTPIQDKVPNFEHVQLFTTPKLRDIFREVFPGVYYEIHCLGKDSILRKNRFLNRLSGRVVSLLHLNEDNLLNSHYESEAVFFCIIIFLDKQIK
jgi:SAM-dependent methyltransferase